MHLSKRSAEVSEEPFFVALNLPHDVLRLSGGEPDFPTADFVNEAASRTTSQGNTHYTAPAGIPALREEIVKKLKGENNISYDPNEILVTPGSSAAVTLLLLATIDAGDEVLVPDPAWFHYATLVKLAGGVPKRVRLDPSDGFAMRASRIEEASSDKTKVLILNSPSNPTGRVLKRTELEEVAGAAERLDLTVVSDEVYERIVYPPNVHQSLACLPGMHDKTIVLNGFSKGYAMTGWRLGYLAAPREMVRKLDALQGYTLVCASSPAQYAGVEALRNPKSRDYTTNMVEAWRRRRAIVSRYVSENPETISSMTPEGAFYAWLDVSASGMAGGEAAQRILEEGKVGVMPGSLFGAQGRNFIRISFATSDAVVEEGMKKICDVVAKNSRKRRLESTIALEGR